jgi:hypothetical protein
MRCGRRFLPRSFLIYEALFGNCPKYEKINLTVGVIEREGAPIIVILNGLPSFLIKNAF